MGIAPIDLQTLFTQVDKVGRAQVSQREGQAVQQAIHGIQIQNKTEAQLQQVNEAQNSGEGADKVNDQKRRNDNDNKKDESKKEKDQDEQQLSYLRDPSLGNRIDIST